MATQDQTGRDGTGATQRTPANLAVQEISSEAERLLQVAPDVAGTGMGG
jgi:hypothetical protein